jgi:hypothetical protein
MTFEQQSRRDKVIQKILKDIKEGVTIKLPDFDPLTSRPSDKALLTVGLIPNPYNGVYGPFRYQFEGEEDLLHLIITRIDDGCLSVKDGQLVAEFVLKGVPPALIWLKPGEHSQHFYVGHDDLIDSIAI